MSKPLILEMDHVTVPSTATQVTGLVDICVRLLPGGMLLLEPERHVETVSFADVASGLVAPSEGAVLFCGRDWRRMGLFGQSAARGRIGRVFESEGWVSNLNMFENITLAQRHHTRQSDRDVRRAAVALMERVGLRDCLDERPHVLSRGERRRAQWVRALLGQRELLLFDAPLRDVRPEARQGLFDLVREARSGGVAVVWYASDTELLQDESFFEGSEHAQICEGKLLRIEGRRNQA